MKRRLVVGITGASGAIYGVRLLQVLRDEPSIETHLVMTKHAERAVAEETPYQAADLKTMAEVVHPVTDIGASIASGSFRTAGMVVIPCAIEAAAAVARCLSHDLLTRAADVTLKEGRPLVLVVCETPLHTGHLRSLLAAAEAGAVILPPVPALATRPATFEHLVDATVARALDRFGIAHQPMEGWGASTGADRAP